MRCLAHRGCVPDEFIATRCHTATCAPLHAGSKDAEITAHTWKLYSAWAALGAFFLYDFDRRGPAGAELIGASGLVAFAVIAIGGLGSVVAGVWADRWGRENIASAAMVVSGACALTLGWLVDAPTWIVVSVALVWGFAIVADSAQFSALVTEVAPTHAVGTALTLQTSLDFALTAASIWLAVVVADRFGWGAAFSLLAVGPAFGVVAMMRLKRVRSSPAGYPVGYETTPHVDSEDRQASP